MTPLTQRIPDGKGGYTVKDVSMPVQADSKADSRPADLAADAVKLARRVQALDDGRVYFIAVIKEGGRLLWALVNRDGGKVEG